MKAHIRLHLVCVVPLIGAAVSHATPADIILIVTDEPARQAA